MHTSSLVVHDWSRSSGGGYWYGRIFTRGLIRRSRAGLGESFVVDGGPCRRNHSRVEVVLGGGGLFGGMWGCVSFFFHWPSDFRPSFNYKLDHSIFYAFSYLHEIGRAPTMHCKKKSI